MTDWGHDFIADCSDASKNLIERNSAWWNKYFDTIQKYKYRIENKASCWNETECGCYAKDEEISIKKDQCVLNLGTFPDIDGFWELSFELKINSWPTEIADPEANIHWSVELISGIGSQNKKPLLSSFPKMPTHIKSTHTIKISIKTFGIPYSNLTKIVISGGSENFHSLWTRGKS